MNNLYKAAETLKTRWGRGNYYNKQNDAYCSIGALCLHSMNDSLVTAISGVEDSIEVKTLATVIKENYPERYNEYHAPHTIVIDFNDRVAESADEVVAMFEKAAIRWDEQI